MLVFAPSRPVRSRTTFACAAKLISPVRSPPMDHVSVEMRPGSSMPRPAKPGEISVDNIGFSSFAPPSRPNLDQTLFHSSIDPAEQVSFYDPGLGSVADGGHLMGRAARWVYNKISQATGLGITANYRLLRSGDPPVGEALARIGKVRLAGASSVKGRQFQACPVRSAARAR